MLQVKYICSGSVILKTAKILTLFCLFSNFPYSHAASIKHPVFLPSPHSTEEWEKVASPKSQALKGREEIMMGCHCKILDGQRAMVPENFNAAMSSDNRNAWLKFNKLQQMLPVSRNQGQLTWGSGQFTLIYSQWVRSLGSRVKDKAGH